MIKTQNFHLNHGALLTPLLLLILVGGVGCSSIKTPTFSSPSLHFNPFPSEIIPVEEEPNEEPPIFGGFTSPFDFKMELDWPVDRARLTRGFLPHARPRPHYGLDLADRRGSPVLAANDGQVIYAGSGFRGYGRFIIIEHADNWATFYGHLDKILIKQGAFIKKGDSIGKMGRTGRATGTHLHFELRHDRKAIDPIAFLPQASESIRYKK